MHSEAELSRLAAVLEALAETQQGMSVVELDGYVVGLIVCPEFMGLIYIARQERPR